MTDFTLRPIGRIRSTLSALAKAPMQGNEGAPDAWIDVAEDLRDGLHGVEVGHELLVLTWFHKARRDVLRLHPRDDTALPLTGVFLTRSPDRPNPIGLHRVSVLEIAEGALKIGPIEAIDGTPVVDLKPVLSARDR